MNKDINDSQRGCGKTGNANLKNIFLVDGHSFLYRAFYGTPYLSNSKGVPSNAIYAFINMIRKIIKEREPDTLVIVFDSGTPSFREDIYREYKAQRQPMPDNLSVQIPYVKTILDAMGLPILEKEGFEADDIIGTIVYSLRGEDCMTYIVTGDKDIMQFVSDRVFIVDASKNLVLGEQEVQEKFGISPSQITDYLALRGDSSDNIPGVPGIGDKTAREILETFGTLDEIYENIEKIKKASVRERLIRGKDLALMSRELATIRLDVPLETGIEALFGKAEDTETLRRLYRELEFTTLYNEIAPPRSREKAPEPVKDMSSIDPRKVALLAQFQGKNPRDVHLECFALFDGTHSYFSNSEDELEYLVEKSERLITHNLKPLLVFQMKRMEERGQIKESSISDLCSRTRDSDGDEDEGSFAFFDTMLASYLINPLRKDYGLEAIAGEFLGMDISSQGTKERLIEGAGALFELKDTLLAEMDRIDLVGLFRDIEMPLIEVLAGMEFSGVRVDRRALLGLSRDFDGRINNYVREIHRLADEPFNINSPKQLSRILFEKLQLPPRKKTKTGYSTDVDVLETLSGLHALPKLILEYRTLAKLKSTYVDVLPNLIYPYTGRIHASFNQMVVSTGRLSSSDPNLQNIPVRGEEGANIRQAFIPADSFILISSDYSQIELRVLAHISGDSLLNEAFLRDEDIHAKVAREVFSVEEDEVTPDMRRTAKVINFGIIYGMSSFGLSKEIGVSQKEAQRYIEAYFDRYRGVCRFIEETLASVRSTGFARTLFGRIRHIPEINNPDNKVRHLGERVAMNTPIQGTAADIIKLAMVNIRRKIFERAFSSRLIMQIHDELVFEVHQDEIDAMEELIKTEMENVVTLSVPLKVSIGKGRSWAEAQDLFIA